MKLLNLFICLGIFATANLVGLKEAKAIGAKSYIKFSVDDVSGYSEGLFEYDQYSLNQLAEKKPIDFPTSYNNLFEQKYDSVVEEHKSAVESVCLNKGEKPLLAISGLYYYVYLFGMKEPMYLASSRIITSKGTCAEYKDKESPVFKFQ